MVKFRKSRPREKIIIHNCTTKSRFRVEVGSLRGEIDTLPVQYYYIIIKNNNINTYANTQLGRNTTVPDVIIVI